SAGIYRNSCERSNGTPQPLPVAVLLCLRRMAGPSSRRKPAPAATLPPNPFIRSASKLRRLIAVSDGFSRSGRGLPHPNDHPLIPDGAGPRIPLAPAVPFQLGGNCRSVLLRHLSHSSDAPPFSQSSRRGVDV